MTISFSEYIVYETQKYLHTDIMECFFMIQLYICVENSCHKGVSFWQGMF